MSIGDFSTLAPYLSNPLTLAGLAAFLFFSVHRTLIRSGIIPPVARVHAPAIIKLILSYGFWIAVLSIILGFAYGAIQSGIGEIRHDVSMLSTRSAKLKIVDIYVEDKNRTINQDRAKSAEDVFITNKNHESLVINVKLINNGTGDAFIHDIRLLTYVEEVEDMTRVCVPAFADLVDVPFTVSSEDATTSGSTDKIPEYILKVLKQNDDVAFVRLYDPVKISIIVPAGGVEWLKLRVAAAAPMLEHILYGCYTVYHGHARVVLYYDNDTLVTQERDFPLGLEWRHIKPPEWLPLGASH